MAIIGFSQAVADTHELSKRANQRAKSKPTNIHFHKDTVLPNKVVKHSVGIIIKACKRKGISQQGCAELVMQHG